MAIIIADIGSCHGNRIEYFERAIAVAKNLGVQLKCQLFGTNHAPGNIRLELDVYTAAAEKASIAGVPFFTSVWASGVYTPAEPLYGCAHSVASRYGTSVVKFAYSQRDNHLIRRAVNDFATVYVSCQHTDLRTDDPPNLKRLLCIPRYPVYEKICGLDFHHNYFPPFYGFSDHTLGILQSMDAVVGGAQVIEKHVRFKDYTDCPDARFAINEIDLEELVSHAGK